MRAHHTYPSTQSPWVRLLWELLIAIVLAILLLLALSGPPRVASAANGGPAIAVRQAVSHWAASSTQLT